MRSVRTVTPRDLKKALVSSGFEVFRTMVDHVVLAERPRENLILDSGVRVRALDEGGFEVRVVLRAEQTAFPGEPEDALFARARALAAPALADGFAEHETTVTKATDPADASRTLDTFYEVHLVRTVPAAADAGVAPAVGVLRFALDLEKHAAPASRA